MTTIPLLGVPGPYKSRVGENKARVGEYGIYLIQILNWSVYSLYCISGWHFSLSAALGAAIAGPASFAPSQPPEDRVPSYRQMMERFSNCFFSLERFWICITIII